MQQQEMLRVILQTFWNDLKPFCPRRWHLCVWAQKSVHAHTIENGGLSPVDPSGWRDIFAG